MINITSEYIAKTLIPQLEEEVLRKKIIQNFLDLEQETIVIPARSTREHAELASLARSPWASKIVSARVRRLKPSGFYDAEGSNSVAWSIYKSWKMVIKEKIAARESATFGTALIEMRKMPGNKTMPINKSVFTTTAFYSLDGAYDAVNADFPVLVMEKLRPGVYKIWDDTHVGIWEKGKNEEAGYNRTSYEAHGFTHAPFTVWVHDIDSSGKSVGVIWPLRHLLLRLQKATYDSGLINHSNSWNVRYATGLSGASEIEQIPGESEEEYRRRCADIENRYRLEIATDTIITSTDKDTKFGTLPATNPASFIPVIEDIRKELASVSETPSDYITGDNIAMSAEQAANSQANFLAIIDELRASYSLAIETMFELHEDGTGVEVGPVEVAWEEIDRGVLASVVDALTKAKSIGVPDRMLWLEYPNMNPEKYDRWVKAADEQLSRENAALNALRELGNEEASGETLVKDAELEE